MGKPLEGLRVIDMSHVIAGPLASLYLAQWEGRNHPGRNAHRR